MWLIYVAYAVRCFQAYQYSIALCTNELQERRTNHFISADALNFESVPCDIGFQARLPILSSALHGLLSLHLVHGSLQRGLDIPLSEGREVIVIGRNILLEY